MTLTWYGHSCFHLKSKDGSLLFDPYTPGSVPGLLLPPLCADKVLCSHGHGDHNYASGVKLTGGEFTGKIIFLPTWHDEVQGRKRGANRITVVETEGKRLAHCGDIGHPLSEKELKELGHIDVLFIPVGGFYTVDAAGARAIADSIGADTVIPMHYRGDGFGYDVTSTVDGFVKLSENVRFAGKNTLSDGELTGKQTVVLSLP